MLPLYRMIPKFACGVVAVDAIKCANFSKIGLRVLVLQDPEMAFHLKMALVHRPYNSVSTTVQHCDTRGIKNVCCCKVYILSKITHSTNAG